MKLNDPIVTRLLNDHYMPQFNDEVWNNSGALSSQFGWNGFGKTINMPSGKEIITFGKGRHASVGTFGDDKTFSHADGRTVGYEGIVRARGYQANARIDVVEAKRLSSPEAVMNIFDNQFDDLTYAAQKQYSRMLYGDGQGIISEVAATAVHSSVTALDGITGTYVPAFKFKAKDIRRFEEGDILTIIVDTAVAADYKHEDFEGNAITANRTGQDKVEKESGKTDPKVTQGQNRTATYGLGTYTAKNAGKSFTGRIAEIDDETSELYFIISEVHDDFNGDEITTTQILTIVADSKIYYRDSVNQDIHGLEYIVKGSADTNNGMYGMGETVYGDGLGKRPMKLLSKKGKVKNFLSEYVFEEFSDSLEMRGKTRPDFMVTTRGLRRSIASTNQGATQGIVRLNRDASASAVNDRRSLGYGQVDIKGDVINVDRNAPKGKLWFLQTNTFDIMNTQNMEFDDALGSGIWKQMIRTSTTGNGNRLGDFGQRVLSYEANMYGYRELLCTNPRGNGSIEFEEAGYVKPNFGAMRKVNEFGEALSNTDITGTPTDL